MEAHPSSKLGTTLRILVSSLAAAAAAALVVTAVYFAALASPELGETAFAPLTGLDLFKEGGTVFAFALVFTAAHAFVLGLPLLLIGIRLRLIRWWSCLLVSFLIGFLPWAVVASRPTHTAALPMGVLGLIGGLTFWLLWHFWVQASSDGAAGPRLNQPAPPSSAGS